MSEQATPLEKGCNACGAVLERREREYSVQWARRKYCSMACAIQAQHAWVKRP